MGAVLFGGQRAYGQEPLATLPADSAVWSLRTSLDGVASFGNIERLLSTTRASLGYVRPMFGATLSPTFVYGTVERTIPRERDLFINLHTYYWPRNTFLGVAFGVFDKSRQRFIEARWVAGAGVGWNAVRRPHQSLVAALAPLFESTHYRPAAEPTRQTVRFGAYVKGRHLLPGRTLWLEHETFLLPSLERHLDYRWRSTLVLSCPITQGFSLRLTLDETYERLPAADTLPNDLRTQVGIAYAR
ncbi:DUF481 domain-containing protein [Hymenobacter terrenus]|uniref:DUF481 domain-containing protein n=1 Tax=Hymenobacter terrenus TaxID=1629124 RepID=UPI00061997DE|nr:DUF481 domain-containing protein [Hymenobacter terrenus]